MSNPKKPTDMGTNKTGIATSPLESKKTIEGAREGSPARSFDVASIEAVRLSQSSVAEPVGTMPPPGSLKGVVKSGIEAVKGHNPMVLLDLIGDRLAFERTGVRLYEAMFAKLEAAERPDRGPAREDVRQIRDEELQHVGLLIQAMEELGGDPTAVTPTADICAVAGTGILKVLTDPRATLTHALHAVHIAELADNDAWGMLADLAEAMGHEEMAANFRQALLDEERHLEYVRTWLTADLEAQAGIESTLPSTEPTIVAP
ncbi:MAG TPA: ferritin-like domain-containing protein [Polyangia bacterium]